MHENKKLQLVEICKRVRLPVWMSIDSPSTSEAMAEHSMCQPGRPGPQGEGQAGSPGFEAFHSAKSLGLRFSCAIAKDKDPSPSSKAAWLP